MNMQDRIAGYLDEIIAWRRDIHKHPEMAFEEHRTADLVAEKLAGFGIEVHRGLARTGVVGTLSAGSSGRAVGLRADMDALPIREENAFEYASVHPNTMHACGHDGHTAMLLGAAKYLAETRQFDGTVHFIFQPAEESAGGGREMVADGLFDKFPVDCVFGMHNWPGVRVGKFGVRTGALMASFDTFDITIKGTGAHGAMPHLGNDPVVIGAQLISALQTIVSRNTDPLEAAVISVTQMVAGDAYNVIPDSVVLRGAARALSPEVRKRIESRIRETSENLCRAFGAECTVEYAHAYPVLVNTPAETELAVSVARAVAGDENVEADCFPTMASEDFAYMLEERPGCYLFIGNGDGEGACMVHNPGYDFNDAAIETGVRYWCTLAETVLRKS